LFAEGQCVSFPGFPLRQASGCGGQRDPAGCG
jgi:hypothetical protein